MIITEEWVKKFFFNVDNVGEIDPYYGFNKLIIATEALERFGIK